MSPDQMLLRDAGHREQAFAQKRIVPALPKGLTFEDLMNHGVYDASRDEISMTYGGAGHTWKVELVD